MAQHSVNTAMHLGYPGSGPDWRLQQKAGTIAPQDPTLFEHGFEHFYNSPFYNNTQAGRRHLQPKESGHLEDIPRGKVHIKPNHKELRTMTKGAIPEPRGNEKDRLPQRKHFEEPRSKQVGSLDHMESMGRVYDSEGNRMNERPAKEIYVEERMGCKKRVHDTRNGIPVSHYGDKGYPAPEYSPNFYTQEGLIPRQRWQGTERKPGTTLLMRSLQMQLESVPPRPRRPTFTEKRTTELRNVDINDVKALDEWEPKEPMK